MRGNLENRVATVRDNKGVEELMEQGRQLHSQAIFDMCAAFISKIIKHSPPGKPFSQPRRNVSVPVQDASR